PLFRGEGWGGVEIDTEQQNSISKSMEGEESPQALVFDFQYSTHRGVIVYVRMFNGEVKKNDTLLFSAANEKFIALEVGIFHPDQIPQDSLKAGEIGYIVTGIKQPGIASVGDTVTSSKRPSPALPGYMNPAPVVWASVYPEGQDDFNLLKQALGRLRLTDASLSYEEETSGSLGRGFRCGFLGMLHLEIITERLHREFDLDMIIATPSITYEVEYQNGEKKMIYSPALFPDYGSYKSVAEPWVKAKIITPPEYMGNIMTLLYEHEGEVGASELFGENRNAIEVDMPLRELMRGFFDKLKSASSGYASLSYKITGMRPADVARLDILVAEEPVVAFTRVVSRKRIQQEAEDAVEKLYGILPRQLFVVKIQSQALGRIISSRTLSALRKDVTGYLYGGDITRKMKLLEKQKRGKKKMKARGRVNIPHEVFLKMMKQ
ncbi:MAG: EF-Tu/IF-2/RF-3 family GTPase, partial [Candidatus Paceibacterota bacterium]